MDNNNLAWCAGIIDGEGCISIHRRKPGAKSQPGRKNFSYRLSLKVKMVHKPAIELLAIIFALGKVKCENPGKNNVRVSWCWTVYGNDAISVITKILPFIVIKKSEAFLAIEYMNGNIDTIAKKKGVLEEVKMFRESAYFKMRSLKNFEWKQ